MILKISVLFIVSLGLSACALFQRDPRSGYALDEYSQTDVTDHYYQEQSQYKYLEAKKELGYDTGRSISSIQQDAINKRLQLNRLEKSLLFNREKKQYFHYKPFLPNDDAKLVFLSLPTVEARERWVQRQGFTEKSPYAPRVEDAIEKSDIVLGMTQKAVLESWGDPDLVEVAGNPLYKNERWRYKKMISSKDGYLQEMRVIYFEGGKVAGWEKR